MSDPKLPIGSNYCLCRECGLYFGGERAFSLHRVGYKCVAPETLTDKDGERVLFLSPKGYWGRKVAKDPLLAGLAG